MVFWHSKTLPKMTILSAASVAEAYSIPVKLPVVVSDTLTNNVSMITTVLSAGKVNVEL